MSLLVLLTVSVLAAGPQSARPSASERPASATEPATNGVPELPVSLERIQRALARPPVILLDKVEKPVFRVEVFGDKPTIEDILGPDYLKGPVKHGGMTHQEFLDWVTPKDVQGVAAFSNAEALTITATSMALQWALLKAVDKYKAAQDARQREAARREVEEALAELEKARRRAGLPPK